MKIVVLEWDVSILGGRQRTMLCFADYFSEMGHEVWFYSNWNNPRPEDDFIPEKLKNWYQFHFRRMPKKRFVFGKIQRKMKPEQLPPEWADVDMFLCPYGNYGYLQKFYPNAKVVCWTIHPDQAYHPEIYEIWTNSKTTKQRLLASKNYGQPELAEKMHVVVPPHSYHRFRQEAKPWHERQYDIVTVGQLIDRKGILQFDAFAKRTGLRSKIITGYNINRERNMQILKQLQTPYEMNVPGSRVAEIMGDAKVYLTFTEDESCSLAIYEAMNASCRCVVQGPAGAAAEQMGCTGKLFTTEAEAKQAVLDYLEEPGPGPEQQGMMFDRVRVGYMTNERLFKMTGFDGNRFWQSWDDADGRQRIEDYWAEEEVSARREQFHKQLVREIRDHGFDRVLDFGCGSGLDYPVLAKNLKLEYTGVDITPAMLAHARTRYPDINVAVDDILGSKFRDGEWPLVVCSAVLPHLPKPKIPKALSELFRITGSKLIVRFFNVDRFKDDRVQVLDGFIYVNLTFETLNRLLATLPQHRIRQLRILRDETPDLHDIVTVIIDKL